MTAYTRCGSRWTINECIQLQREFELLELSIDEISARHKRTPNAIMFKLDQEGLGDYNVLYSNYHGLNEQMSVSRTNKYDDSIHIVCGNDNISDYEDTPDDNNDHDYVPNDESEDDDEDEEVDVVEEDNDDLKQHIMRLEKQVNMLTEMLMKSSKNKSLFSLFS